MKTNAFVGVLIAVLLSGAGHFAMSDEGEGSDGDARPGVARVTDTLYTQECGSCHFAYQPGWLPAASWRTIMAGLADHFGENAELPSDVHARLTAYLVNHAADSTETRFSRKVRRSLAGHEPPVRITEVPYIVRKHHELPARLVTDNDQVKSLGNCNACHRRAEAGVFNEHEVDIPGFGTWDD